MTKLELENLIQGALDGSLSQEEFELLEHTLLNDPQALDTYKRWAWISSSLDVQHSHQLPGSAVPIEKVVALQKKRSLHIALVAAAAIVLLSLVSLKLFFVTPHPSNTLVFQSSPNTQFELTHSPKHTDESNPQTLHPGSSLSIEQGSVELQFSNGVRSIILAPAQLTLTNYQQLHLKQGSAWFDVPPQAVGFTVTTKELEIIDLGTQFGVHSTLSGFDEVHVFKGSVQARSLRLKEQKLTLTAGQSRSLNTLGALVDIPNQPEAYLTQLPNNLPNLHWSFDDDYQSSGSHPDAALTHTDPMPTARPPQRSKNGVLGHALALNGKQQFLLSDWKGFSGDRSRSASFWIKVKKPHNDPYHRGILGWGDPNIKSAKWTIVTHPNADGSSQKISLTIGSKKFTASTPIAYDHWQHVAVVYVGAQQSGTNHGYTKIYINGQESKVQGAPGSVVQPINTRQQTRSAHTFRIGQAIRGRSEDDLTRYFRGLLDEVYIFDGSLTDSQIKELAKPPFLPNRKKH
ncbi:LamG-like jellyroll fold domain-containing protein [Rubritalea tangerina]|uniref:LamG-like jellyroll fold domain-containing protein n=2 Tax=Rubritalea tangerina TaxID=430798 RepID=A0ABW4Z9C3_9BACT